MPFLGDFHNTVVYKGGQLQPINQPREGGYFSSEKYLGPPLTSGALLRDMQQPEA